MNIQINLLSNRNEFIVMKVLVKLSNLSERQPALAFFAHHLRWLFCPLQIQKYRLSIIMVFFKYQRGVYMPIRIISVNRLDFKILSTKTHRKVEKHADLFKNRSVYLFWDIRSFSIPLRRNIRFEYITSSGYFKRSFHPRSTRG